MHFKPEDFVPQSWASAQAGNRKVNNLKKGTVPSVFSWTCSLPVSAREERRRAKEAKERAVKAEEHEISVEMEDVCYVSTLKRL